MILQAAAPSAPGLAAAVRITSYAVVVGGGRGEWMSPGPCGLVEGTKKNVKIPPSPQRISGVKKLTSEPSAGRQRRTSDRVQGARGPKKKEKAHGTGILNRLDNILG